MNNLTDVNGDNFKDGVRATADTAEAEEAKAAAVPDKFRDLETLVKAYTELEAEFTRRSQRLRELEKGNKVETLPDGAAVSPSPQTEDELLKSALSNGKVRDAVIGEFLKSVAQGGAAPVIAGGGGVSAPKTVPKSVKEAGKLAERFLNKPSSCPRA